MRIVEALLRRVARGLLVLTALSLLVFAAIFATPGADPAARLAGRGASPAVIAQVRAEYGLDRPWPQQYLGLMRRLFVTRDLPSFVNRGQLVVPTVLRAAPVTLALAIGAALLWSMAGLAIGTLSARPGSAAGRGQVLVAAALLGVSVPAFWLGEMVMGAAQGAWRDTLFAWVPPPGLPASSPGEWLRGMALPWLTLAVLYAGIYARVIRTGLLGALRQDYVRTARAKGLGELRVTLRHALPNAIAPAIALLGLDLGALLGGGTVLIEMVFGLPGIGRLAYDALHSLDVPMVMACTMYSGVLVVLASAVADVGLAVADPRAGRAVDGGKRENDPHE